MSSRAAGVIPSLPESCRAREQGVHAILQPGKHQHKRSTVCEESDLLLRTARISTTFVPDVMHMSIAGSASIAASSQADLPWAGKSVCQRTNREGPACKATPGLAWLYLMRPTLCEQDLDSTGVPGLRNCARSGQGLYSRECTL